MLMRMTLVTNHDDDSAAEEMVSEDILMLDDGKKDKTTCLSSTCNILGTCSRTSQNEGLKIDLLPSKEKDSTTAKRKGSLVFA